MSSTTAATSSGSRSTMEGSNSMPTETKNSTAKASCSGNESAAALWLKRDSLSTTPAKKAPSAKETPNSLRSEEHTSELKSLMRISYAVYCLKKKKRNNT